MATLRAAVKTAIEGDGTLAGLLTGGVYDRRGINRTATPDAYDANGELKPCAVVTVEAASPLGHREWAFEQVFVVVYLYEEEGNGYAAIDQAGLRLRTLFHNETLATTDGDVHHMEHADSLVDMYDEVLKAEMGYERFVCYRRRGDGT